MTASSSPDLIDQLAGLAPGHPLDAIRAHRAQARLHSQQSYLALFEPAPPSTSEFTRVERFAVAAFVAAWHRHAQATRFYAQGLARHGAPRSLVDAVAAAGDASDPQGAVPGARLSAALVHAHLLVFRPRDAGSADLQRLLDAGWSADDIVTLSQLVAFLAFQLRVVAGLQVLASQSAEEVLPS